MSRAGWIQEEIGVTSEKHISQDVIKHSITIQRKEDIQMRTLKGCVIFLLAGLLLICLFPFTVSAADPRPALVSDVNNPDKLDQYGNHELLLEVTIADGRAGEGPCLIEVPAGKRLVIEHVSMRAVMPAGQKPISVQITDTRHFNQYLVSFFQGTSIGGHDIYIASQAVRQRVPPGERVCLSFSRNSVDGVADVRWGISGYFINYP
jgi:hypothetical protein